MFVFQVSCAPEGASSLSGNGLFPVQAPRFPMCFALGKFQHVLDSPREPPRYIHFSHYFSQYTQGGGGTGEERAGRADRSFPPLAPPPPPPSRTVSRKSLSQQ
jgi:hypothetical protein